MKVSELEGADLDYWVAKAAGYEPVRQRESAEGDRVCIRKIRDSDGALVSIPMWTYRPSRDWAYGGPIIEREGITLERYGNYGDWTAAPAYPHACSGPTPLVAAMRAYVTSEFGEEVLDEASLALENAYCAEGDRLSEKPPHKH